MKIPVLVKDIREGKYSKFYGCMSPENYVVLPRGMIVDLLLELNKRRKVMSRPKVKP